MLVLTYGHAGRHRELLARLAADGIAADQVTLVHNPLAPDDDVLPWAPAGTEVVRMAANVGYAPAMNAVLRRDLGTADTWLLLTHDVRPEPGAVRALLAAPVAGPSVLGPALVREDGSPYSFGGTTLPSGLGDHRLTARDPRPTTWVDGCALRIDAEVLRRAGLFEERFFLYFEETELCLRAARAGCTVGVVEDARFVTSPGRGSRPMVYAFLMTRNGLEYARRWGGRQALRAAARAQAGFLQTAVRTMLSRRAIGGARRREAGLYALGLAGGWAAFARGRWGPPPPWTLRGSDVRLARRRAG